MDITINARSLCRHRRHFQYRTAVDDLDQLRQKAHSICVYFMFIRYLWKRMVIHSDCICGQTIKLAAPNSSVHYACNCGRHFDIRLVACKLCGNSCAGIFRPGMSPSDMCRMCGVDHQMAESVLTIRQSGLRVLIRKSLILRIMILATGIGLLIGLINIIRPQ